MEGNNDEKQLKGKTKELLNQVDEVKEDMKKNLDKILLREENLHALQEVSKYLKEKAYNFNRTTEKVACSYWWKNVKLIIAIILVVLIIVIVIVLLSVGVIPISAPVAPVVTPTTRP